MRACNTGHVEIVFKLFIEEVALYVRATIAQVGVPALKSFILECEARFAMFLTPNKQFYSQSNSFLYNYIGKHTWRTRSESKGLSENRKLSGSKDLNLKNSRKRYRNITILGGDISGKFIFSNKSGVAAITWAGHLI